MDPSLASLLHRVNNLLTVIFSQVEVVRLVGGEDAKEKALVLIEQAARGVEEEVRRFRDTQTDPRAG